jgi:hypothetical protein
MLDGKLTRAEFAVKAIKVLRKGKTTDGKEYHGIHLTYSGLMKAWKEYFGTDPVTDIKELVAQGVVVTRPAKGGYSMYLPEDAKKVEDRSPAAILTKILG